MNNFITENYPQAQTIPDSEGVLIEGSVFLPPDFQVEGSSLDGAFFMDIMLDYEKLDGRGLPTIISCDDSGCKDIWSIFSTYITPLTFVSSGNFGTDLVSPVPPSPENSENKEKGLQLKLRLFFRIGLNGPLSLGVKILGQAMETHYGNLRGTDAVRKIYPRATILERGIFLLSGRKFLLPDYKKSLHQTLIVEVDYVSLEVVIIESTSFTEDETPVRADIRMHMNFGMYLLRVFCKKQKVGDVQIPPKPAYFSKGDATCKVKFRLFPKIAGPNVQILPVEENGVFNG